MSQVLNKLLFPLVLKQNQFHLILSFILEFVLSLTVNALFYSDEAIYEINQEKEDTSVISKYSRVIYSAIISGFLNYIIELLESLMYVDMNEYDQGNRRE